MATLDELRLQQLLRPLEGPSGIVSLNPLAFQYQDQFYPNQMQYQYPPRTDISPTQDFYQPRADISPTQDFYPPREFVNVPQNFYPPNLTTLRGLDMNKFQGVSDMSVIDETTNDEQDQEYIDQVNQNNQSGITKLFEFLGNLPTPVNILRNILPEQDPRATGIRNFYSPYEGLTSTGSVASGIMKGYNPVSGGLLFKLTGGKFGKPTQYGLADAMQRRIEKILDRKAPQTDASRAKIAELRNLQRAEMEDRFDRGESLSDIGKSTFSGKGMAFEKRQGTTTGKGTANERNYGGR